MEADGLERGRIAGREPAAREFVEARGGEVDREFGPAQHDLGQLVEMMRLLVLDEARRGDVAGKGECGHARKHERRHREFRPCRRHPGLTG